MHKVLFKTALLGALFTVSSMTASVNANCQRPESGNTIPIGMVQFMEADDFRYITPGQKGTFEIDFLTVGAVHPTGEI